MDIYLLIEGQQQGPYTEDQVRESLAEGLIPADLPAWHEGLDDWVQVESLVGPSQSFSASNVVMEDAFKKLQRSKSETDQTPDLAPSVLSDQKGESGVRKHAGIGLGIWIGAAIGLLLFVCVGAIVSAVVIYHYTSAKRANDEAATSDQTSTDTNALPSTDSTQSASSTPQPHTYLSALAQAPVNNPESASSTAPADSSQTTTSSDASSPAPNKEDVPPDLGTAPQEQEIWTYLDVLNKEPNSGDIFGGMDAGKQGNAMGELDNKITAVADKCDAELPADIKEALDFVRSKYKDRNVSVFVLPHIPAMIVVFELPPAIQIASIKDLNPDDIIEQSSDSDTSCLVLNTTGRKPVAKGIGAIGGPYLQCLSLTAESEVTNQRLVNAFTDIIKHYGGQPEPSIDDAKTAPQLINFIQERLNKANLRRTLDVRFDEKSGTIDLIYGAIPGWTPPGDQDPMRPGDALSGAITQSINVKDMKPEDFTWQTNGDNPSALDVGIVDAVDFRGNKLQIGYGLTLLKCPTEQDAKDVAIAFQRLCKMNGWTPSKY